MKKETLIEIIIGTVGGLIFAIGMCMCLIQEWNLFTTGIVITAIGFIVLLCIIPIYRKSHPKKEKKPIDWSITFTWVIGIIGALIMGFGMSKIMVGEASRNEMIFGIITGVIGLLICVLNYPVHAYLKKDNI